MLMILPKTINERFYKALKKKQEEYGRGFNKFICGETGYSTGYMSQVLNEKQAASQEAQMKICEILEMDYKSFLKEQSVSNHDPPGNAKEQLTKETSTDNVIHFKSAMERKHFEVIKTFHDQETALIFNRFLSKLEKLDIKKYEEIYGIVRGEVKEIEKKMNQSKENSELAASKKEKKHA